MRSPTVNPPHSSENVMNRIDALFTRLRSQGRRALMPFLTAGDPELEATAALIGEMVTRGADMVELGIPYSDPIADGPVIAESYTRALRTGIKLASIFAMVERLRSSERVEAPIVTMVSYAIVHRHGVTAYLDRAVSSGVDGLIVPDLPVEEAADLCRLATARNLSLIQLVTPTTPRDRALKIIASTTGFLYYVSVAGITGERRELPPELADNVAWLRSQTKLPVCIGFGISGPDQIRQLAPVADGLIVGSALVRRLRGAAERPRAEVVGEIGGFVEELARALTLT
ncbi:MAG: tryptophan synthase, alpha subunit [Planctomycetota bacterium]|nr:tryptophan synthase, alpha subunit [Planctomycetota bacterium]